MVSEARRERSRRLYDLHTRWVAEQLARGVDGPAPPGSPDPTDYNQHFVDMEADGEAMDAFHDEARCIMGLS